MYFLKYSENFIHICSLYILQSSALLVNSRKRGKKAMFVLNMVFSHPRLFSRNPVVDIQACLIHVRLTFIHMKQKVYFSLIFSSIAFYSGDR